MLCLLEMRELFDKFLLTKTREADGEFDVVAAPFTAEDETSPVLLVPYVRTRKESTWSRGRL